jgi:predicted Zn-dependent peptidase
MLKNGMKVIVVPNQEVPFVSIHLGLLAGAWAEAKAGSASMAMQMLSKGTAGHSEAELAEELEYHAISLSGSAGMDTCSAGASCLSEHLQRAMNLLAEVVVQPTFPEEELAKLKKRVRTELAVAAATPAYVAEREFRRRLYAEHPYARSVSGEPEDVAVLSAEDLRSWWAKFVRPDLAVLIVSGAVTEGEAVKLARKAFGNWEASGEKPLLDPPPPPEAKSTHVYLVDRPILSQSQIRIGQLSITRQHPDYFTTRVISNYFGGAFGSRLNGKIRVEKGLTYGIGGGYYSQRFVGAFEVQTFTKRESTADAVRAILDEVERLRQQPPAAEELGRARSYILGSFPARRETPQQAASSLWTIESNELPADYFEQMLAKVAQTQAENCARVVRETVDPSELVIVVVGNAQELKGDLAKIAPVTVVLASGERKHSAPADHRPEGK